MLKNEYRASISGIFQKVAEATAEREMAAARNDGPAEHRASWEVKCPPLKEML